MKKLKTEDNKHLLLIEKRQQLMAEFITTLSEKQFKLFKKFLQSDEKLKKQEMLNLAKLILTNKKR